MAISMHGRFSALKQTPPPSVLRLKAHSSRSSGLRINGFGSAFSGKLPNGRLSSAPAFALTAAVPLGIFTRLSILPQRQLSQRGHSSSFVTAILMFGKRFVKLWRNNAVLKIYWLYVLTKPLMGVMLKIIE
jgi:hypothetical protein